MTARREGPPDGDAAGPGRGPGVHSESCVVPGPGTPSVAVLVLTHGRDEHLLRQQEALARETGWDEAVVCFMDQDEEPWASPPARVRTVHLASSGADAELGSDGERAAEAGGEAHAGSGAETGGEVETAGEARSTQRLRRSAPVLNLSLARNTAARATQAEVLVFLDVDCIPAPGSIAQLAADCRPGRLVMADPRYLPPSWDGQADPEAAALAHPARADLGYGAGEAWHMFWSLGFAVRARDLDALGGFDETFSGYGGEDTDLAFRCREAGMTLWLSRARVLHQPHAVYRPPLQHVESIVINARRFHERWGVWPMDGWLAGLAERGLIEWSDQDVRVLRLPDDAELAAARVEDAAFG